MLQTTAPAYFQMRIKCRNCRFMSAYEQKVQPPDKRWQYILFAAEPYETIAFKIPSREVDKTEDKFWTLWNKDTKQVTLFMKLEL